MSNGYIYIRSNEYWDFYDVYKLGKTLNIPDREQTYITSEIRRGKYIMVIEIDVTFLDKIEKQLQTYFNELNLNTKFNAGTEFYKKEIMNLIIPYFESKNIKYNILSNDEIDDLVRKGRRNYVKLNNRYNPRDYQCEIIDKSYEYFQINQKGMLIIPCGGGKTLTSLWIAHKLSSNTILIGVPNKLLLIQWKEIICNLFEDMPYLIVSGSVYVEDIANFLENNGSKCIVITTYASSFKIYNVTQKNKFIFSMKINDEVHHLTSTNIKEEERKTYINMLKIKSEKQLSLTATLKLLENKENEREEDIIVSNDNVEYFGNIIDRKCLLWAINKNIICDYVIQTIITNEEQMEELFFKFNIVDENDQRLFLSAYACLKSIHDRNSHHLLVYSNSLSNSLKLKQYITNLLDDCYFDLPDLYYTNYHSEMKQNEQNEIIKNFDRSVIGVIICVYCLGEGYDNNKIDGVVFSENMSSNIRIVQSSLRASRKNINEPNKITKIILPILNRDDWLDNNNSTDLKKVREVIYQIGLEDETIMQKVKILKIDISKYPIQPKRYVEFTSNMGDYDDELTKNLILKTIKRTALGITYEKAIKIISDKNIKSKDAYYELCEKDNRLTKEPEIVYRTKFKNWIDYLSIERIYYDFETCKEKVNEYLSMYSEIKSNYLDLSSICKELCKIDNLFPPNGLWDEYYDQKDLKDIIVVKNCKKQIGIM